MKVKVICIDVVKKLKSGNFSGNGAANVNVLKNITIIVSLRYLFHFWGTCFIPLRNCEVQLVLI